MGMISPEWEEEQAPVPQDRTRITLWLHSNEEEDVSTSIGEQFETIHEEMLLFLRKIQRITVRTYDSENQLQRSSMYSRRSGVGQHVSTERLKQDGGNESRATRHFYLTRYMATGLLKSEIREYDEDALASESYASSEIVLSFPLTEDSVPILENQWLFSFLPVSQMGFKVPATSPPMKGLWSANKRAQFLIQADFVTSANRESVETTSSRNRAIGERISAAFVDSVLQMCEHETLSING